MSILIPLMLNCELIAKNSKIESGYNINSTKWIELIRLIPTEMKLHLGSFRERNRPLLYYICLGDSHFSYPAKQRKAVLNKKLAFEELTYLNVEDKKLRSMINRHLSKFNLIDDLQACEDDDANTLLSAQNEDPAPAPTPIISQVPILSPAPTTIDLNVRATNSYRITITPQLTTHPPIQHIQHNNIFFVHPTINQNNIPAIPTNIPNGTPNVEPTQQNAHAPPEHTPTPTIPFEAEVNFALLLNFENSPRQNRNGDGTIIMHEKKQACESHRMMTIFAANKWGCNDFRLTLLQRERIKLAACRLISYDYGYRQPFGHTQIKLWEERMCNSIRKGPAPSMAPTLTPLVNNHKGSISYIDALEKEHPGYIRSLFRYSQKIRGSLAIFEELASTMNQKSATDPNQPTTTISRYQLEAWFKKEGGKDFAPTSKPLDTPEHIEKRMQWVRTYYELLTNETAPVTYLDEKWFYTTNRRRRVKKLPRGPNEEEGVDIVPPQKVRSRHFPVKAMFMGVVGRPINEKNFDGKIHLERVSKTVEVTKLTAHQNFCDDVVVNCQIKQGGWRDLHVEGMSLDEMRDAMKHHFALDDAVCDRIEFIYKTKIGRKGNTKEVRIKDGEAKLEGAIREEDDPVEPSRPLTLNDLNVKVRHQIGDTVETDVNCDSQYMLAAMDRVGAAIRAAYHWIPLTTECYLVMDNAGGHGTSEAIEEYVAKLKNDWNVKTIFQIPRSPYTNVLDLGVWCSLQSRVEKEHFGKRCEVNALASSVTNAWTNGTLDKMITSVFKRLRRVLVLIIEAKGKNDLVETKRGKKFAALDLPIDLTDEPPLVEEVGGEDTEVQLNAAEMYEEETI